MAVQRKTKKQPALKPAEKSKPRQGLVICYIGAGKGKTTAAMGVVARAAGSGMNVHVLQFVMVDFWHIIQVFPE
jgi:cob(I)alamin adenosyltransferase